jgi:hypothetical protein
MAWNNQRLSITSALAPPAPQLWGEKHPWFFLSTWIQFGLYFRARRSSNILQHPKAVIPVASPVSFSKSSWRPGGKNNQSMVITEQIELVASLLREIF